MKHPPLFPLTTLEVSTREVLDLAVVRPLQTAEPHSGSSSGTVSSSRPSHLRLAENVPAAKLRPLHNW